jgi:hypothetical protein
LELRTCSSCHLCSKAAGTLHAANGALCSVADRPHLHHLGGRSGMVGSPNGRKRSSCDCWPDETPFTVACYQNLVSLSFKGPLHLLVRGGAPGRSGNGCKSSGVGLIRREGGWKNWSRRECTTHSHQREEESKKNQALLHGCWLSKFFATRTEDVRVVRL